VQRVIAEMFREPEALYGAMPLGLSAGQVLSLPMIVIGLWLLVMLQRTPARRS
jgi:phosphatidylglycerol:prolipoprotein diacylglycerol transferase